MVKKRKVLALISGGIDSPVAAYMFKEKGYEVLALHTSNEPFTDDTPERKSRAAIKHLGIKKLIIVNISEALSSFSEKCDRTFYFVLQKRFMMRVAEAIAKKENCEFIVTGESLAQVSSQTLTNLATIEDAIEIPIVRPLIGLDKQTIIDIAEKIGTFRISKGPEFCDVLGLKKGVKTAAKLEDVKSEEKKVDVSKLLRAVLASVFS